MLSVIINIRSHFAETQHSRLGSLYTCSTRTWINGSFTREIGGLRMAPYVTPSLRWNMRLNAGRGQRETNATVCRLYV